MGHFLDFFWLPADMRLAIAKLYQIKPRAAAAAGRRMQLFLIRSK
jgi:hypothetical protein